jgi:hypothetical protein
MSADCRPKDFLLPLLPFVERSLNQRVRLNFPPAGFDPRAASIEDLARFHLPPRPDARNAPLAFRLWSRAMSPPLFFFRTPDNAADFFARTRTRSLHRRINSPGLTEESSGNWSGGYVRPRDFNTMTLVQGIWKVPAPAVPNGSGDGKYECSIWVGIDGHEPASRAMPQIGTAQNVTVTGGVEERKLFGWWQWWARDQLKSEQTPIPLFPVQAGDTIYAQITVLAPDRVNFILKNLSNGFAVPFDCTMPPPDNASPHPLDVEGQTAEWIVERPSDPDTQEPFTLADYDHMKFIQCNAVSGTGATADEQQLQDARLIRMNLWDDPVNPGRLASEPTRAGNDALAAQYIGAPT